MNTRILWLYFGGWFIYFAWFWSHAFSYDPQGDLLANHVNLWGDWAAHFTMGSSFAYRSLTLTQSPFLLGSRFSYPFVMDWLSGLFIRLGTPFLMAFTIPSFLASCLLVVALYYFFVTIFNRRKIALLASLIFLLNGGLGFVYFARDIATSPTPLVTFSNPPHEYTRLDDENLKWISVIDSMVIPQRAFTLGFPLTLLALTWIYQTMFLSQTKHPRLKKLGTIAILGTMPLIHTHSFMAAGIICGFWLLTDLFKNRTKPISIISKWLTWGIPTLIIAAPIFSYFFAGQVQGFIKWYPGWLALEFKMNWLVFWFKNWALTPLLALLGGYLWLKTHRQRSTQNTGLVLWWLPFVILFVLANLFLFQPFSWDNTKLIAWAAIGFAGLTAYFLTTVRQIHWLSKGLVLILLVVTLASGTIDAYRILRVDLHQYVMFTQEELQLAEWAKTSTSHTSIWLTGSQHNHWLFDLTGRQTLMAYPGWLWTQGYNYFGTEANIKMAYAHPETSTLINKSGVDYVVIGPGEMNDYSPDVSGFLTKYQVVKETEHYLIFATGN